MGLTKAEIVERILRRTDIPRKDVGDVVDRVFERIKATLASGEKVKLSGFGNFIVHDKRARRGRNPQTGEEITITSRRVLSFRPSQILRDAVNAHTTPPDSREDA